MNCYLHPDREASAYCRTCGRPLCAEDQREVYGVVYCQECLARPLGITTQPAPGPQAAPAFAAAPAPAAPHHPSPGIALLLGFIPGVGAIYNGQYMKAFLQVVIFAFLISMANTGSDFTAPFFGLGIAIFYFYMLIDSYRTAKQMESGQPVTDIFNLGANANVNVPTAAIVLIVIGGIFLLRSLGFFYLDLSRYFWPAILIGIGIYLLMRQQGTRAQ